MSANLNLSLNLILLEVHAEIAHLGFNQPVIVAILYLHPIRLHPHPPFQKIILGMQKTFKRIQILINRYRGGCHCEWNEAISLYWSISEGGLPRTFQVLAMTDKTVDEGHSNLIPIDQCIKNNSS